jgi:hypothetical protein
MQNSSALSPPNTINRHIATAVAAVAFAAHSSGTSGRAFQDPQKEAAVWPACLVAQNRSDHTAAAAKR